MKRFIKPKYQIVLQDGVLSKTSDGTIIETEAEPIIQDVASLEEASRAYKLFLYNHNLSSSEASGGIVLQDNEPVAYISYNGKIWDFENFVDRWGTGIIDNSNVLKSLGYRR